MTVKRWSVGVDGPDENGNLVAYADYLSLAAENSSLRLTIDNIVNALKLGDGPVSQQVIEIVTSLTNERDKMAQLIDKMADIGDLINTQNNRCTDQPFFAVLTKREYPANEDYGYDRIVFVNPNNDYEEADERTHRRLEALHDDGRDLRGWDRVAVIEVDEFRVGCFTEQGCKDYINRNGHNLNKPFIYAYGSYRNNEFQSVRKFLTEAATLRAGGNG